MNFNEEALKLHAEHKGKIEIRSKVPVNTRDDLSTAYTPGVAEPCRKIHADKKEVYKYTAKGNLVAVVSDGTAVLGLGDIGPEAAMPVMDLNLFYYLPHFFRQFQPDFIFFLLFHSCSGGRPRRRR